MGAKRDKYGICALHSYSAVYQILCFLQIKKEGFLMTQSFFSMFTSLERMLSKFKTQKAAIFLAWL